MKRAIALILAVALVTVVTPATARGGLRAYIEGKVEGREEWFHWGTLGTSKPELKLELRGTKSRGNIVKYEWDFGDGSTAEGEYVTHTYYSGNWNITLTVYDKRGRSASETLKIEVKGGKPQVVQQEEPDIEERIKRLESEIADLKKKMTEILKRIGEIEQKFYGKGELKKAEKKKLEKTFTWNYKERLIITVTGRRFVKHREFAEEVRKVFGRELNLWGAPSLLYWEREKVKGREITHLDVIKSCHTIFMVRPECLYDLENLEEKYPELLPLSTEKLKSFLKTYGYPLLYFSRDYTGMIRGVIIAKEVIPSLARVLTKKPIPLDTPLQYKNGKLKKAEKSQGEAKKTFTWTPKDKRERVIVTITGRPRPRGIDNYDEFAEEIRKVVSTVDLWLAPSLLYWEKKKVEGEVEVTKLDIIKGCHSIFVIRPQCLYDFHNLEAKYPDLLPVSTEKLESFLKRYGDTLLYFSHDYTGMLRGVILTWKVNSSLAKLLTEKPIPLETPLRYENGKLEELEK